MPLTVRLNWPLPKFAAEPDNVGDVTGFTTTGKLRVALNGGIPLSATLSEMGMVELACETNGRKLKVALVLLI